MGRGPVPVEPVTRRAGQLDGIRFLGRPLLLAAVALAGFRVDDVGKCPAPHVALVVLQPPAHVDAVVEGEPGGVLDPVDRLPGPVAGAGPELIVTADEIQDGLVIFGGLAGR